MARRKERSYPVTELPGYRDIVEIGGGAFATVYRALEEDTGRPVALKALKVETVHPRLLETFTREIQALAQVSNHPNIVTLYRPLITPDQRPVLVLELCQESLSQRIRRVGPLSAQDVTGIGIKIAGALETAHRHGFLHRDMKPQNILITEFEEPALSDFGVAALQASAQAFAGVFGFTTLHAAPEILEGHQLSAATDIYGLASTMYQMLSGFAPFATFENEAPASVILRIIRDPVRPLRSQDIPIGLSDLLESALSKDPDSRPHSAVEFADALVALEATSGWPATPYVVWGERSKIASASDSVSALPTMPVTEEVPIPPLRAGLTPRPPSVTMPNVGRPQPRSPAPPPPAAAPPAAPASASPPPAAAPPAAPPPAAPGPPSPPPTSSPPVQGGSAVSENPWSTLPPPPPPPLPRAGPSLWQPITTDRSVVPPDQLRRGPDPGGTGYEPIEPLPSLYPEDEAAVEADPPSPPVYLDPDPPLALEHPTGAQPRSPVRAHAVFEDAILPSAGALLARQDDEQAHRATHEVLASPVLLGGMAAAAIVIVAMILLAVGVL